MHLLAKVSIPIAVIILLTGSVVFLYIGIDQKNRIDHDAISLQSCSVQLEAGNQTEPFSYSYHVSWSNGFNSSCQQGFCGNVTSCPNSCDLTIALYNCGFDSRPLGGTRDAMVAGFTIFAICIALLILLTGLTIGYMVHQKYHVSA
jgi:hypothetical protein